MPTRWQKIPARMRYNRNYPSLSHSDVNSYLAGLELSTINPKTLEKTEGEISQDADTVAKGSCQDALQLKISLTRLPWAAWGLRHRMRVQLLEILEKNSEDNTDLSSDAPDHVLTSDPPSENGPTPVALRNDMD